jgi:hypothetical protein
MPCLIEAGYAWSGEKVGCGNMINMLNVSDQTELAFAAVQRAAWAKFDLMALR